MQSLLLLLSQALEAVLFAVVSRVMQGKLEFLQVWMYTTLNFTRIRKKKTLTASQHNHIRTSD